MKNPTKLCDDENQTLQKAFDTNPQLKEIYQLRQDLKELFDKDLSKNEASLQLELWQQKAQKLNNKPIESFLKTLNNWKDKVLNFFHQRITNAMVEGLNNAIRGIIRRSFGFQSFQSLKLRVITELG